jgi:hypothetical protein
MALPESRLRLRVAPGCGIGAAAGHPSIANPALLDGATTVMGGTE